MPPKFFIIPSWISETQSLSTIAPVVSETLCNTKSLFVETAKETRRFLKYLSLSPQEYDLVEFQKDFPFAVNKLEGFFESLTSVGLLSDAGVPAVGDPGYELVLEAHRLGFNVTPLPGSSSIILSLMGSGLLGQKFIFHGYIPNGKDGKSPEEAIKKLISQNTEYTHIFIETPYNNERAFSLFCKVLSENDHLSISQDILGKDQSIHTKKISLWKKTEIFHKKIPCVYIVRLNINEKFT